MKKCKNTIISTGGGFYKQENINKIGKVVYLKSSFQGILDRINTHQMQKINWKKKTTFKNMEEAKTLWFKSKSCMKKLQKLLLMLKIKKDIKDIVKEILGQI